MDISGKRSSLGKGNSKDQSPEVEACLLCSQNSKEASMTEALWVRMVEADLREVNGPKHVAPSETSKGFWMF